MSNLVICSRFCKSSFTLGDKSLETDDIILALVRELSGTLELKTSGT